MYRAFVRARLSTAAVNEASRKSARTLELERVTAERDWKIAGTTEVYAIGGSKGREKRPAFHTLLKDANRRKFGLVAAWSVDLPGRPLKDLLFFLDYFHSHGTDLSLHQQGIDTTTPTNQDRISKP
ncbi:MAG: recombinase family protein [SAR324 cluster bacterium]|nr:recombinase family protein [SAR324 cluster bacterium]